MTRRLPALLTAAAVAVALWLGTATPGLASANEAPSPPTLGVLMACAVNQVRGHPTTGSCPAIVRSSSSAVVTTGARRPPGGLPGPPTALLVVAAACIVALVSVRRPPAPILGRNSARAPPLSAD